MRWRSEVGLMAQRINAASKPSKFDLAPQNHKKDGVRSDWDMQTDPEESDSRIAQKRMLEQIVAMPATLYFPSSVVAELNEICESLGYTPEQLVIEALKAQIDYWNEFYEHVMTLPDRSGRFCLAEESPVLFSVCHNYPYRR